MLINQLGPFIDKSHPCVTSGNLHDRTAPASTAEDLFYACVTQKLLNIPHCLILLVPHTRDLLSRQCSFPQEPFDRKGLGLSNVSKPYVWH